MPSFIEIQSTEYREIAPREKRVLTDNGRTDGKYDASRRLLLAAEAYNLRLASLSSLKMSRGPVGVVKRVD